MSVRKIIGLSLMLAGLAVVILSMGLYRLAGWELVDGTLCGMVGIALLITGVIIPAKETLPRVSSDE